MPSLRLERISKTFSDGAVGLHSCNLEIQDGECLAIVGPSGSGKSTFLRLIAGLEDPDTGSIFINGQAVEKLEPYKRNLAFVAQKPALYPTLTVADNLSIGLQLYQKTERKKPSLSGVEIRHRVEEVAQKLQISHLLGRGVEELSGGEQRRVALGRAIVRGADLWLMDEPLSQLDSHLRYEICSELLLLRRQLHATIIYVTHNPIEALLLANRVGVLGHGRFLQVDRPEKIVQQPDHLTVAVSLGYPSINLFFGSFEGQPEPNMGSVFYFRSGEITIRWVNPKGVEFAQRVTTVAIHPEDIEENLHPNGSNRVYLGEWEVLKSFPHHWNWFVTFVSQEKQLVARWMKPNPPTNGTRMELFVPQDRFLWFDDRGNRVRAV